MACRTWVRRAKARGGRVVGRFSEASADNTAGGVGTAPVDCDGSVARVTPGVREGCVGAEIAAAPRDAWCKSKRRIIHVIPI